MAPLRLVLPRCFSCICLAAALLAGCLLFANSAAAQSTARLQLDEPDASAFPTITAFLQAYDAQGLFIRGIAASALTVLENDQPVQPQQLEERRTGTRLLVAINPGPGLGARNDQGIARYEPVQQALVTWSGALKQNEYDDYSWVTNEGAGVTFTPDPGRLQAAIEAYQSEMRSEKSSLASLARALELASDATPRPGMSRAILYITTAPAEDQLAALQDLSARAQGTGVRIFIWAAASVDMLQTTNVRALQQTASITGGSFFLFSGSETLPDIQSYTAPLGSIYTLSYISTVTASGTHRVAVRLQQGELDLTSPSQFFSVEVLPPNPIFLTPPTIIERTCPAGSVDPLAALAPRQQEIKMLVEFPDGHPRPLVWSRFYVNGALADENTQPPFDQFTWDLTGCSQTDRYQLRIEVADSLGLSAASIETPVEVAVTIPPATTLQTFQQKGSWKTALALGAAGVLVASLLLFSWRRYTRTVHRPVRRKTPETAGQKQPTLSPATEPTKRRKSFPWRRRTPPRQPEGALLIWLEPGAQPITVAPVIGRDITVGRDPEKAMLVIDLPGVDGLHARLRQLDDGNYRLLNQNSVGGTWVNFQPVGEDGVLLQNDDLVHFGKAAFQYRASQPGAPKRIHTRVVKDVG